MSRVEWRRQWHFFYLWSPPKLGSGWLNPHCNRSEWASWLMGWQTCTSPHEDASGERKGGMKAWKKKSLTAGKSLKNFSWTWDIASKPSSMLLIPWGSNTEKEWKEETALKVTLWGRPEWNSRPSILIFHIWAEAVPNSRRRGAWQVQYSERNYCEHKILQIYEICQNEILEIFIFVNELLSAMTCS